MAETATATPHAELVRLIREMIPRDGEKAALGRAEAAFREALAEEMPDVPEGRRERGVELLMAPVRAAVAGLDRRFATRQSKPPAGRLVAQGGPAGGCYLPVRIVVGFPSGSADTR